MPTRSAGSPLSAVTSVKRRSPSLWKSRLEPPVQRSSVTKRSMRPSRSASRSPIERAPPGVLNVKAGTKCPPTLCRISNGARPFGRRRGRSGPRPARAHRRRRDRRTRHRSFARCARGTSGPPETLRVRPTAVDPVRDLGSAHLVARGRTIGEGADEQVDPTVTVDVGRGHCVHEHAGERRVQPPGRRGVAQLDAGAGRAFRRGRAMLELRRREPGARRGLGTSGPDSSGDPRRARHQGGHGGGQGHDGGRAQTSPLLHEERSTTASTTSPQGLSAFFPAFNPTYRRSRFASNATS